MTIKMLKLHLKYLDINLKFKRSNFYIIFSNFMFILQKKRKKVIFKFNFWSHFNKMCFQKL